LLRSVLRFWKRDSGVVMIKNERRPSFFGIVNRDLEL
jgi:hypothetical protein